jgi:hypothetical protein
MIAAIRTLFMKNILSLSSNLPAELKISGRVLIVYSKFHFHRFQPDMKINAAFSLNSFVTTAGQARGVFAK